MTTARSQQIGKLLGITNPAQDRNCTTCHAPWQTLSRDLFPEDVHASVESVSCETCHGPAVNWIRSHTRPDLTRTEKTLDGLRDLTAFYNRANVCVACHQALEPRLIESGHPELLFEMDGQTTGMTRHWIETDADHKVKGWLTGQAAALRELTAQLTAEKKAGAPSTHTFRQWQSVLWLLGKALPEGKIATFSTNAIEKVESLAALHAAAEQLALSAAAGAERASALMVNLSGTGADFSGRPIGDPIMARRAEKLVLAMERLFLNAPPDTRKKLNGNLDELFSLVQSRPAFDAQKFAEGLEKFRSSLTEPTKR